MSNDDERTRVLAQTAEALIFAADDPVSARRIAAIYAEVTGAEADASEVEDAVERLNTAYEENGRAFRIEAWAGGYRMATRADFAAFVKVFFAGGRERSLSRSLMETLAIVAYRQPVTRPEIEFVRGVSADYAVRKLLEYNLIDVYGRADSVGRPLLYRTSDRFLEQFGLAHLDDLPTLREIEDLLDDPLFSKERAELLTLKSAEALDGETRQKALEEAAPSEERGTPDSSS